MKSVSIDSEKIGGKKDAADKQPKERPKVINKIMIFSTKEK